MEWTKLATHSEQMYEKKDSLRLFDMILYLEFKSIQNAPLYIAGKVEKVA